ncbi:acetyl-CoA carboxylase biotin carboxylase subunit [Rubrivirga marina]|uniref:Biotin carboxylase n=1 Tax=Rubrivirga marina TaxID=1196024 RepID=A0A271J551_9BACT|nr:acetyl-CoA carboxylase biotin carboxylase subunit [Rubrivirga marina]PAP78480.1 acetyl-CoA carboxylase biotin carboxylase subunit [Rubrivirga marina]
MKKVLIANRGEIALRIIRTCREMGLQTVAVYSTVDRDTLAVRFADEAVCIGPAPSAQSYLKIPAIIAAAEVTGADAIHPGYGFLSENAEFARICDDHDLTFIGPKAETISKMGDKSVAKETMQAAGVPVVPGSDGAVEDVTEGLAAAREAGFPVMIKASAGGGGKGMRMARDEAEFEKLFVAAGTEAQNAFGDGRLYIEKFVEEPRHIEIQLVGDGQGTVVHFGERECSIQRRHQKLLEEAPSPILDPDLRQRMGDAAIAGALAVDYRGAGTVEFLVDKNRDFYFMEMNTRIQVEHPVTEEVTDTDLIEWQLRVAEGEKITSGNHVPVGHSIECRINAEDPFRNFSPSPGKITAFHSPKGRGVRCDTHVYAGYTVPPTYDSMIAKLIVRETTRDRAITKMLRALDEFIIEGLKTTVPFHQQLLQDPRFVAGDFDTKFLERFELTPPE